MASLGKFSFLIDVGQFQRGLATMQQSAETCRAAMMQQFNTIALDSFLNNLATVKNAISEVISKENRRGQG